VKAAAMMASEPITIQLRYLQTLTEIGAEKNTTIVFPLPVDMLAGLKGVSASLAKGGDGEDRGRAEVVPGGSAATGY
jgi:hypothetical protein